MQSNNTIKFQNGYVDENLIAFENQWSENNCSKKLLKSKYKDTISKERQQQNKLQKLRKFDNDFQTKKEETLRKKFESEKNNKQRYYFVNQQLTYLENKVIINKFWNQIDKYSLLCQFNDFSTIKFLTDCGLLIPDEIEQEFKYRSWLWKYAYRSLDGIKRKSATLAKIIAQTIFDDNVF